MADNLFLFGLNGNDNLYKRVYNVFGGIAKQYYPAEMPELVAYDKVANTSYLQALAGSARNQSATAELPSFSNSAPAVATFAKREWAIEFESGKASFKVEASGQLDELLNQMAISGLAIQINGHTDNIGDAAGNLQLAKKRAEAVRSWLETNAASAKPGCFAAAHTFYCWMNRFPASTRRPRPMSVRRF